MQEEFEKKIKERMHTFGIQPAHDVWDGVDAALNRQKHRRFFVGWWILLGLVVLGGAILLLDKDGINSDKLNQQPTITRDTANNNKFAEKPKNADTENKILTENSNKNNQQAENQATLSGSNNSGNGISKKPSQHLANTKPPAALRNKGSFAYNSHTPHIGNSQTGPAIVNAGDAATVSPQGGAKNASDNVVKDSDGYNNKKQLALLNKDAGSTVKPPKLPQDTVGTFTKPNKTDLANNPQPVKAKTIANLKSKWFLTFSAGTTQTVSSGAFNVVNTASSFTSANSVSYTSVPAITALSAYKYNMAQPSIGFHISAGGLYERQLSAHWAVSGGLSVAYLSNTQQAGQTYKGALDILASNTYSLSSPQVTLQSYFQPGSTGTVVNKAWQAEVPVGVGYVFNPKGKTKFMLNAGFSFAWLFASAWLIPDARYDKLYYSKTIFNTTAVNWQAGPAIEFKNQWRFGLQYQQSFTTIAKNYVTPKLYWQNISIYTAIPLGRAKKHK